MNTEQLLQKRYDEIERRLAELAARWESEDHGGMTREEYGAQDAALVAERQTIERTFAAMRRANAEAEKIRRIGSGFFR